MSEPASMKREVADAVATLRNVTSASAVHDDGRWGMTIDAEAAKERT